MSFRLFRKSPKSPEDGVDDGNDGASKDDQAAYERRRNQVRRAQRNHRERKANYIKALEQEVVNLRNQSRQNIRGLENEINLAHAILLSHGLSPPPRQVTLLNTSIEPKQSSYTVSKSDGLGKPLRLHIPPTMEHGVDLNESANAAGSFSSPNSSTGPNNDGILTGGHRSNPDPSAVGSVHEQLSPASVDKIHGIDFVLSLEHPCMAHPHMTRDQYGTHSHMATHNLLQHAPLDVSGPLSWEIPSADIERLLELSTSFDLQGELTPVQAWYRLKQHPSFGSLSAAQILRLKGFLTREVKCYGFGSVIDEQIWSIAVEQALSRV